jgi:hypothetical protein
MPAAVEISNDIKFNDSEAEAVDAKLHHDFKLVGTDFAHIGNDFLKLITDVTSRQGASELKIAQELKIDHAVLKLDTDFLKISDGFLKLDSQFTNFGDGFSSLVDKIVPEASSLGDSNSLPDLFLKLDTDFKGDSASFSQLGPDFLKLDSATASTDSFLKVADDFLKVGGDLKATSDDFKLLGDAFIKLGESSELKLLSGDFIKFGEALTNVGTNLGAVSDDYLKIGLDFQPVSDTSEATTIKLDQLLSQLQLEDHVHKLADDSSSWTQAWRPWGRNFSKSIKRCISRSSLRHLPAAKATLRALWTFSSKPARRVQRTNRPTASPRALPTNSPIR